MADLNAVRKAIDERSRAFEQAYAESAIERMIDGYFVPDADGPTAYPPAQAPVCGRAALTAMFTQMRAATPQVRLETADLVASDTLAYEVGRAHLMLPDGSRDVGRYAVLWMTTDKGWRAKTDFFTADGWPD